MATPKKRGRENACAPPETPNAWTLPADLILEIVARSDHRTLVRSAATCNSLRRDILNPSFIHRVSQEAPCILAYLCPDPEADNPLVLVHPATPPAASFCLDHLSPFISRRTTAGIFRHYIPVTSRHGLVLLERRYMQNRSKSGRRSHLCVYDPMSRTHTFFSKPPDIKISENSRHKYVLLTAVDGIDDDSFLLLVVDLYGWGIKLQSASSRGTWGPVMYGNDHDFPWWSLKSHGDPAILHGAVIHWLACQSHDKQILSYNLGTGKSGSVKLPHTNCRIYQLHLGASADGKRLKLISIEGFMMFVWLQLPISPAAAGGGGGWALESVIDMEEKLRLLDPSIPPIAPSITVLHYYEKKSGDVVLLRVPGQGYFNTVIMDLETKDMHRQEQGSLLLEIDLPSRLEKMKIFS